MDKIKILALLILVFFACNSFATNRDSTLIDELKKFITEETGFLLDNSFYTTWSKSEEPIVNLYISSSKKVGSPYNNFTYTSYGTQEEYAKKRAAKEEKLGHHTFIYKTYATSIAELNNRFISMNLFIIISVILDRFDYNVNNAYLLKNRFYAEKYFLLKRVFQKAETLTDFLKIIQKCPPNPKDFEVYINSFL